MRILFLTHAFNSLAQRLYLELGAIGHEVSVELDISDAVSLEAVALYRPDLVVAPYLKRAIPEALWRHTVCLVVHPGIAGDRGPSALDHAILDGETEWGLTVLQAEAEMDAGPVWATEGFAMREVTKSSLYRREVTEAAVRALLRAVRRHERGQGPLAPAELGGRRGQWRAAMRQAERAIDWQLDDTRTVLRKLRSADGAPGVLDSLFGQPCRLFDAHAEALAQPNAPGTIIARRDDALLRATRDGAVWIGHVRGLEPPDAFKLPAALAFAAECAGLPQWPPAGESGWQEIRYRREGSVGTLHFDFYNGAMSTAQCRRLLAALRHALAQPDRVLVLAGGSDFWSNGIHLNVIEAADSPADESWRNIEAMNDLVLALIEATDRVVVAAMQGNAGAGGVFMALAADRVWVRRGAVLNPHYKNMGNLYGSEYWSYLLPRRLDEAAARHVMQRRLPVSADEAVRLGLVDAALDADPAGFLVELRQRARQLAASADWPAWVQAKRAQRLRDEALKPLATYRAEEMSRMRRNFYGFDPSYHIARSNFVRRVEHSWTPRHLAVHRDGAGRGA